MTRDELLIEVQPFSRGIKDWCRAHPDFAKALKILYPERFITLGAVGTSYSPYRPNDQVIGFYTYAYRQKTPIFKQDFIVNVGGNDTEFVLYTRYKGEKDGRIVKDINEFFATYGKGQYYVEQHHLKFDQLPELLKERATQAINLAGRVLVGGIRQMNDRELEVATQQFEVLRVAGEVRELGGK